MRFFLSLFLALFTLTSAKRLSFATKKTLDSTNDVDNVCSCACCIAQRGGNIANVKDYACAPAYYGQENANHQFAQCGSVGITSNSQQCRYENTADAKDASNLAAGNFKGHAELDGLAQNIYHMMVVDYARFCSNDCEPGISIKDVEAFVQTEAEGVAGECVPIQTVTTLTK